MLVYQSSDRRLMFAQAHNDYLQLAAEGGLLVALPAIVLVLVVAGTVRRRLTADGDDVVRAWCRAGSVAGLAGIGAQSLVEFSLQMPGNMILFVLLLSIALHRPPRERHAHRV
jgi:O-antigen ligase